MVGASGASSYTSGETLLPIGRGLPHMLGRIFRNGTPSHHIVARLGHSRLDLVQTSNPSNLLRC